MLTSASKNIKKKTQQKSINVSEINKEEWMRKTNNEERNN